MIIRPPAQLCKIAVLTAALQEPGISRAQFTQHPKDSGLQAALWWISEAKKLGIHLELSTALAYPDAYVPAESMLDPVALHLPIRTRRDGTGDDLSEAHAQQIIAACGKEVQICDLGYFDNPLHHDPQIRNQVHQHILRNARAAVMLKEVGCDGIAGFVGRNFQLTIQQNVKFFEDHFIPLLKELKAMGLRYYVENCPMPGWTTGEMFVHNIAYCPFMWILLCRVCEKHGVLDAFRITYDESHDILMGSSHHASILAMKLAGYGHVLSRTHGKNQYRDPAKVALHTIRGQMAFLGCEVDGQPHPDHAACLNAWGVMTCSHGQIGIGQYNPAAQVAGVEADWFDLQYALRDQLQVDAERTFVILEHEFGKARTQDMEMVMSMLAVSVDYIRGIDAAADALHRSKAWSKQFDIPLPGTPNPAYNIPGLEELVQKIFTIEI